jgi:hypothetical protein
VGGSVLEQWAMGCCLMGALEFQRRAVVVLGVVEGELLEDGQVRLLVGFWLELGDLDQRHELWLSWELVEQLRCFVWSVHRHLDVQWIFLEWVFQLG